MKKVWILERFITKDRLCSTSGGTYGVRRCSICEHFFQDLVNEYNYCPNCGAYMRGEDNEQTN